MYDRIKGNIPKRRERRAMWATSEDRSKDAWRAEYRVVGSRTPYKALAEWRELYQQAVALPLHEQAAAVAAIPPLRHRGHGGRHQSRQRSVLGRAMQNRSRY